MKITGTIEPYSSSDTYSLMNTNHIKGGVHHVSSLEEMNNIPLERRSIGMFVVVGTEEDQKLYQLVGGINNDNFVVSNLSEIDNQLDFNSNNPVKNSVISNALSTKQDTLTVGTGLLLNDNILSILPGFGKDVTCIFHVVNNFPIGSVGKGSTKVVNVNVPGAKVGDSVIVNSSQHNGWLHFELKGASVETDDIVSVYLSNPSSSAVNVPSTYDWHFCVIHDNSKDNI